ncbi:MAG: response regulator [Ignavibacteria bacterium]|nr:response regulator [Ignavibacteria bacterium]
MELQRIKKILMIEDEAISAKLTGFMLSHKGYKLIGVTEDEDEAIRITKEQEPDLILADIHLSKGKESIPIIEKIRYFSTVPVVYYSGDDNKETVKKASRTSNSFYVHKSMDSSNLMKTIKKILK